MKKTLLLLLMFCGFHVHSQYRDDKVTLKNGSIIYGKILENDSSHVKIESNKNIWNFPVHDVEKVEKLQFSISDIPFKKAMLNMEAEVNMNENVSPVFNLGLLSRMNDQVIAGGGIGFTFIEYGLMPVYADFRYALKGNYFLPVLSVQAGTIVDITQDNVEKYYYGLFTEIGPMLYLDRPKDKTITLSAGWRFTYLKYEEYSWSLRTDVLKEFYLYRFYIKLGVILH